MVIIISSKLLDFCLTFVICDYTFIEADLVSEYDHAFSEQLVLQVLSKKGAKFRLQQLPATATQTQAI